MLINKCGNISPLYSAHKILQYYLKRKRRIQIATAKKWRHLMKRCVFMKHKNSLSSSQWNRLLEPMIEQPQNIPISLPLCKSLCWRSWKSLTSVTSEERRRTQKMDTIQVWQSCIFQFYQAELSRNIFLTRNCLIKELSEQYIYLGFLTFLVKKSR